mmetsp:Transcript_103608/g.317217  ORF Transcript_103608/g.317217 Transcript_103608/m.317217 type:complete len:221 (+) Transcript_103608:103-765(+)
MARAKVSRRSRRRCARKFKRLNQFVKVSKAKSALLKGTLSPRTASLTPTPRRGWRPRWPGSASGRPSSRTWRGARHWRRSWRPRRLSSRSGLLPPGCPPPGSSTRWSSCEPRLRTGALSAHRCSRASPTPRAEANGSARLPRNWTRRPPRWRGKRVASAYRRARSSTSCASGQGVFKRRPLQPAAASAQPTSRFRSSTTSAQTCCAAAMWPRSARTRWTP